MKSPLEQALTYQPRFNELVDILSAIQKEGNSTQALSNPRIVDEIEPLAANLRSYTANTLNGFSVIVEKDEFEEEEPKSAGSQIREYNAATDHKDIEITSTILFTMIRDLENPGHVIRMQEPYQLVIYDLERFIDFFKGEENPRGVWERCMCQIYELFPGSPIDWMREFECEELDVSCMFEEVQIKNRSV